MGAALRSRLVEPGGAAGARCAPLYVSPRQALMFRNVYVFGDIVPCPAAAPSSSVRCLLVRGVLGATQPKRPTLMPGSFEGVELREETKFSTLRRQIPARLPSVSFALTLMRHTLSDRSEKRPLRIIFLESV